GQAAQGGEGQSRRVDRGDAQDQPSRRGGDQGQVGQQGRDGQGGSGQRGCPDHHQVGPKGEGQGRVGDPPSQWEGGRPQGAGGRVPVVRDYEGTPNRSMASEVNRRIVSVEEFSLPAGVTTGTY